MAEGESARRSRLPFAAGLAAVGLAGLVVRTSHALALLASPAGETLVQDAAFYHREALRILGTIAAPGPGGPSFMNVGLPYALAAIYSIAGPSVRAALLVQAVLGSLTAVLLALAVERMIGSRRVALAAGFLWALYAQAVFYDGLVLTPSLTNDCLAVALLLLALLSRGGGPLLAVAAGLAVGLAAVLRANLLLLVPVVAVLLLFVPACTPRDGDRRARRLAALLFVAGAAAVPLPIVLFNGAAHGEWVPVSANGGMNFWAGNNQDAQGIYYTAPFLPGRQSRRRDAELPGRGPASHRQPGAHRRGVQLVLVPRGTARHRRPLRALAADRGAEVRPVLERVRGEHQRRIRVRSRRLAGPRLAADRIRRSSRSSASPGS